MRDLNANEDPTLVLMVEPRETVQVAPDPTPSDPTEPMGDKVFSGASDSKLPSNVQSLSLEKRRQWVGAWNGRFKQCQDEGGSAKECESSAFAVANSTIKKELSTDEAEKFYNGMVEGWDIYGAQFNQEEVNYNSLGATEERGCANCRWFIAPGACIIVFSFPDPIVPNGISDRWEAKKVFEPQPLEVVIVDKDAKSPQDAAPIKLNISLPERLVGKAITALKALMGHDDKTIAPFVLYKDRDGSTRWFAWATNKWRDRDYPPEILSDKAHRDYVAYVDRTGDFPEAWLWHTPGSKWGQADWVEYDQGFLMASGTVDSGREHVAETLAKAKGLGVSHGFQYRHSDVKQGIIGWYRSFEISPLPVEAAANPWTSLEVLQKELEDTEMNAKKREFLVTHLGEAETKRLEANTEELKSALEAKGVEWKDVPEDDPRVLVVGDEASKEMAAMASKAAAEALVSTPAFKAMVEAQAGYEARFKGIEEVLAELKKSDDAKVAAILGAKGHQPVGHVATAAEENILTGDALNAAKKDGPEFEFFNEIMEGLEIEQPVQ